MEGHNFGYFKRTLKQDYLTATNRKYLIEFAEKEIEEWTKFLNEIKPNLSSQ